MTARTPPGPRRAASLAQAASIIAAAVPDLSGLVLLLADAGQHRRAGALWARLAEGPPTVGRAPRPDAAAWAVQAIPVIGGRR